MNARPSWVLFVCKKDNKNRRLDKSSQSFLIYFLILLLDKKMSKSIAKIAPGINKYLRNVFTIPTIQDIAKF